MFLNFIIHIYILYAILTISGCSSDAEIASENLSKAADMFEINRRIRFYDSIQGSNLLVIEGLCSIEIDTNKRKLNVTCKTGANSYKKHFLGLADNITYISEQLDPSEQSVYHYRVIFKPDALVPNIEVRSQLLK